VRVRVRFAIVLVGLGCAAGPPPPPCRPGRLEVTVKLDAGGASADQLTALITIDGVSSTAAAAHVPGASDGTIAIDLAAGYAAGRRVAIELTATASGKAVAQAFGSSTLVPTCTLLTVHLQDLPAVVPRKTLAFRMAASYPADGGVGGVAASDLNGDGAPDLVIGASWSPGGGLVPHSVVAILQNDGQGRFSATAHTETGATVDVRDPPSAVTLADVDGNGTLDVIAANEFSSSIAVLTNDGTGTLGTAQVYAVPSAPLSIAAADLDGDGKIDLAVAGSGGFAVPGLTVLRNNGDGTFATTATYTAGASPHSVAALDLDGDARPELIVAGQDTLSVLRNNGDGTFVPGATYAAGSSPTGVAVADVDGDGLGDVVVTSPADSRPAGVSVLRNLGNGDLSAPTAYDAGYAPTEIAAADLTGDGRADLFVTGSFGDGYALLVNGGDGTLAAPVLYAGSFSQLAKIAVADFDGDGQLDVAVGSDGKVMVLGNEGGGRLYAATAFGANGDPDAVVAADIDGDGRLDLVTTSSGTLGKSDGVLTVLLGKGDGSFAAAVDYAAGAHPSSLAVGDLDGDGHPDLAVADKSGAASSGVNVLFNRGDGSFEAGVRVWAGAYPGPLALGDLDSDGRLDLLVGQDVEVVVVRNLGGRAFAAPAPHPAGTYPGSLALTDLDGDGHLDVAVAGIDSVQVLTGDGAGGLGLAVPVAVSATRSIRSRRSSSSLVAADLDADGRPDLAFLDEGIVLLFNNGDGSFATSRYPSYASSFVIGDLDGDGAPDLVVESPFSVLLNERRGQFSPPLEIAVETAGLLGIGDFDGDGREDVTMGNLMLLNRSK
jgi:hypothetical protein